MILSKSSDLDAACLPQEVATREEHIKEFIVNNLTTELMLLILS